MSWRMSERGRPRRAPLLSVVLPVYDVERHLEACMRSIARQPVRDHELLVVDDGSPDRSIDIVRRRAAADRRIKVLRQPNAGLGAARNAGVARATGEFLAFVDSDDVLPRDAWGSLVSTLRRTGSDLAIGAAERCDGHRRWTTPLMARNHAETRLRTSVERQPLLLADVFAWNKVFRRSFWDDHDLGFPVGTRYEDQPAMTRALLRARSVDVLSEVTYLWWSRDGAGSLTQRRHELADLRDRIATKVESARDVRAVASAEVATVFLAEVLPVDMWEYFRAVPGCSAAYWSFLVDGVRQLWNDDAIPFHRTRVPAHQRLMGWLTAADRRADLELLLDWVDRSRPLPYVDGELQHPWVLDPEVPPMTRSPD